MEGILVVFTILPLLHAHTVINAGTSHGTFWHQDTLGLEAIDEINWDQHPCKRTCIENSKPMECRYTFRIEEFLTMSKACYDCPKNVTDCSRLHCITGDGMKRMVTVVNRLLPGPAIEVCQGDHIVVDVINAMSERSTTLHWHGQHHRETPSTYATPYMDGVPYVTQCPILPGHTFRYHFVATTPGTHFWHSHIGFQRGDGVYGPLTVKVPKSEDIYGDLYDYDEHNLIIADWNHEDGNDKFAKHYQGGESNKPPNFIVNGRGRWSLNNNTRDMPLATFNVKQNFRYRFRLVNAEYLNCPIEMSIDNHTMIVISTDGSDIEPVEADILTSYAGERFDFILKTNQRVGNYWIRFRGLLDCDKRFTSAHQVAILHYDGADDEEPDAPVGYDYPIVTEDMVVINGFNLGMESNETISAPLLNATIDDDNATMREPDYQFFMSYDFYALDAPHYHRKNLYGFNQVDKRFQTYTPQMNHMSYKMPPFPVLSQRDMIGPNQFCNSTFRNCDRDFCACTHTLQVKLNSVVEIIFVDEGVTYDANHPFHLHGYQFRVIGMERLGKSVTLEEVKELEAAGLLKRKFDRAPLKDTVTVPDGGYTIIRFVADNPGYWLFHCHLEFHVEVGMAFLVKVGDHEDFPAVPENFPRCSNYVPDNAAAILKKERKKSHVSQAQTTPPPGYLSNATYPDPEENEINSNVEKSEKIIRKWLPAIIEELRMSSDAAPLPTVTLPIVFALSFLTIFLTDCS